LQYNLYLGPLHLVVWGDGADLTTSRFVAVGLVGSVTFYGRVPAQQDAPAGPYGDALVATIYFQRRVRDPLAGQRRPSSGSIHILRGVCAKRRAACVAWCLDWRLGCSWCRRCR